MFRSIQVMFGGEEGFHFHSQQIRNKKFKFKKQRSWPEVQGRPLRHVLSLSPSSDLPHQTLTVSKRKHVERKRITKTTKQSTSFYEFLQMYYFQIENLLKIKQMARYHRNMVKTCTNLSLLGSGWWAGGLSCLSIVRSLLPVILCPGCAVVWLASCSGRCAPCCSWCCSWCRRDRATCLSCR